MTTDTPTGPRHLHAFVHHDGSVTLTDPMHGHVTYTRGDIVAAMLEAMKDCVEALELVPEAMEHTCRKLDRLIDMYGVKDVRRSGLNMDPMREIIARHKALIAKVEGHA